MTQPCHPRNVLGRSKKVCPHEDSCVHVHSGPPPDAQKAETTQMSISGWRNKQNVVYPSMGYYSTIQENEGLIYAAINPENITLSKRSQSKPTP